MKKEKEIKEVEVKLQKDDGVGVVKDSVLRAGAITNFLTGKGKRRVATVFLYERVGNSNVFEGTYPLLLGTNKKIFGEYCLIDYKGKMKFVDLPSNNDFTLAKNPKIGKIIEFVKFAEDDFRLLKTLNNEFYHKETRAVMEEEEVEDEETNEVSIVKVPKLDDDGKIVKEEVEVKYVEPKGITQEARDVIRQGNEYEQGMKDYRKRNQGFLEKYQQLIVPVAVLAVCLIMLIYTVKTSYEYMDKSVNAIDDLTDQVSKTPWYADEKAINNIANKVQQKNDEAKTPPS